MFLVGLVGFHTILYDPTRSYVWSYYFYDPSAILNVLVRWDRKIVQSYDPNCDFDNHGCIPHFSVGSVHCSWDLQVPFSFKTTLKLGPMALFTHLKIILLQCFQFSTISGIQRHPIFGSLFYYSAYFCYYS